jgi:hypothetical protein
MKHSILIPVGVSLLGGAISQDAGEVEIEKVSIPGKATHDAVFVKGGTRGVSSLDKGIRLEFSKAAQTRIVSARFDDKRAAIVIQLDEFFLEYREYELRKGDWSEAGKYRLRGLNGYLATALKRVRIEDWGNVTVRFGNRPVHGSYKEWELAVVNETFEQEDGDTVESFKLADGKFVGDAAPVRINLTRTDPGWSIMVRPNGSGGISCGPLFVDHASFPKGTVAFGPLLQTVAGRKIVDPQDPGAVSVGLKKSGQQSAETESRDMTEDWDSLCRQIQPHLRSMDPERLNRLLKKHPLAKDLPDIPVKMMESLLKDPAMKQREDKAKQR